VLAVVQRGISTFIVQQAGLKAASGASTGAGLAEAKECPGPAPGANVLPNHVREDGPTVVARELSEGTARASAA
jgi:hypothetical protein